MYLKKFAFYLSAIFLITSCSQKYNYRPSDQKKVAALTAIEELVEQRKEQAFAYDIDSKYEVMLARFNDDFLLRPTNTVIREYRIGRDSQSAVIDETVFYLFYLTELLRLDHSPEIQKSIAKVVDDIILMDKLNGFDGYLPRSVTYVNGEMQIVPDEIHSNSYSLIMFGYYSAFMATDDDVIKAKIANHVAVIAKYYLDNDLVLRDDKGQEVRVSNLNKRHLSRELDALVIFEIAGLLTRDQELKDLFKAKAEDLKKRGYIKNNKILHLSIFNFQIPSHSSSWLNLVRLYALAKATDEEIYKHNFMKLYQILAVNQNPFFDALYMDLLNEIDVEKLNRIEYFLQTFPIELDNREIVSSYKGDTKLRPFPRITKNYIEAEPYDALPIYRRPLKYFEWKENQLRIDGNWHNKKTMRFSGIDYLVLYGLYKNLSRSQSVDNN